MKMKRNITRIALVSLLVMSMMIGKAAAAPIKFITISTGPVGGEWYVLGGILSEILKPALPGIKVTATTGGGIANISTVANGKSDIGTTQDQLLFEARRGLTDYAEQGPLTNVVGLAYLADIYMSVFLVREDMDINSLEDIAAKKIPIKILTAPKGSTPSRAAERMLAEYGVTGDLLKSWGGRLDFVSYADASSMIRDGHADAYCGPIMPAIIELTVSRKMKMLPVKDSVLTAMTDKYAYGRSVLPEGLYDFVKTDTPVMTESPVLVIREDIPEDVVYNITKAIATNADKIKDAGRTYAEFKAEVMPNITGGPIHPGALKYYREVGWVK
jgi:TRAP transporter TAXI family solute receptor